MSNGFGNGQDSELLGDLRDHRRRTSARAAAHAGRDEQHVGALDHLDDAIAVFHRCLPADFRICARAQTLRDVAADLQRHLHLRVLQRLRIGVQANEVHALDTRGHHVRDGITAAAADADHFDDGPLILCICKYKHR
jgi:hypothetical protein